MTTLVVCSIGGHLSQMHALVPRLDGVDSADVLWVTHDSAQSRSLLDGQNVEYVPYIDERDVLGVAKAVLPAIGLIRRSKAERVISTGSAIAGAYLPVAAALRRQSVFIESAAMVHGHTRTGRILERVPGVALLTQSPATADRRWRHCGSVFDGFTASRQTIDRQPKRLVVTVGTSREFGFRNLIERLIRVVPDDVEVLWQTGSTDVADLPIVATPWLPSSELEAAIRDADVVVSHAGGGSALASLLNGKRPILVPRRASHAEFNDDHQQEIAKLLGGLDLAVPTPIEDLNWDLISDAAGWTVVPADIGSPIKLGAVA